MNEKEIWEMINSYMHNKYILFNRGHGGKTLLARRMREAGVSFKVLSDDQQDYLVVLDSDPADVEAEDEKRRAIFQGAMDAFGASTPEDEGE